VGVPVGAPVQEQVAEEETVEEAAEPAEAIEVVESPEPVAPVMTQFYDDPAMGWFIQGYWTAGVHQLRRVGYTHWTTDVVELDTHFEHYHGEHRVTWKHTGPSMSGITGNGGTPQPMAGKWRTSHETGGNVHRDGAS